MDYISLFITIIGIFALIGLYFMGKRYSQIPPTNKKMTITKYTDSRGKLLSSVMADIAATDGSTPTKPVQKKIYEHTRETENQTQHRTNQTTKKSSQSSQNAKTVQLILFISAKEGQVLDGNLILQAMGKLDLHFGDMDIFHYLLDGESLFRVANGVEPWTLIPEDIKDHSTPGLSMMMQAPTLVDDTKALTAFIHIAKKLAEIVHGELKNMQQEPFSDNDEIIMRDMLPS